MDFGASENLSTYITRVISEKIIQNDLKPGERVLESKLAQDMGVSRSPIREALRTLEKNRLVELIPRRGARVTKISASQIDWFYDIFNILYGLVARKATEKATPEDRQIINEACKKIEKCADKGDADGYFASIFQYAGIAMKAAGNPLLEKILLDLWPSNQRIQFASLSLRKDELKTNVKYFRQATKYLLKGDAKKVEKILQEYAENEKEFALKMVNKK